jgi:hypothetical protein
MKTDNNWHPCVVVKKADGNFSVHENLADLEKEVTSGRVSLPMVDGQPQCRYNEAKWNWNKGQPIVDFGEFQMAITDMDVKKVVDQSGGKA